MEKNEELKISIVSVALYVDYLVNFLKVKSFLISKQKYPIPDCPNEIQDNIMRNFTQGIKKSR